jgi:3-hydroxy-9,10-secoandrosta-1,3,5(10)-triene-9,17-dione monooxygenase
MIDANVKNRLAAIAAPEPDLTPDEIVARAAAMRGLLREDAPAAEERGGYSIELHQAFTEAGFYRILQPRRFGGYEFGLDTLFRVVVEISRGDPGIGWSLCLAAAHVFHVASFYSEHAQAELMGLGGHFCSPHRAAPTGTAAPVDGGYTLSGKWDYASGITHATHFMATALAPDPKGGDEPIPLVCVVPQSQVTVLDDWGGGATLGLQSTGSNTVVLDEVFVPTHLAEPYVWKDHDIPPEGTPGYQIHGNPMYLGRTLTCYLGELVSPQVGAALAALDEYELLLHEKDTIFPPRMPRTESPFHQQWYGEIVDRANAAHALLIAAGERYMEKCRRWEGEREPFTVQDDARIRGLVQQAGKLAWGAVDLAFATAGSSAAKRGSRLARYYRDVSMYRTHIGAQYEVYAASSARAYLGRPLDI